MSLDRFTKPKKKVSKKTTKSKATEKAKAKKSTSKKKKSDIQTSKLELERKKFHLSCTARCGYKRTLKKRVLTDEDFICRKCGKKMKIVKS
ncbi:hypothetical protein DSAG12_00340 [Promethearchaeum syntrophicum]|uniref:Uncharacterized protein n=1 Tax=Promethearchaeum syntrophicum TaxID=2594042 RepID=A0A5B9D6V1_9ARCH|nr:hypothetical protein [Candidatus Prometheoarchaeum syntrophicum]QEE14527.1 hypothetical protein DSAG12_00340 [Candidatus Prometheoarchaeum syntrophicum]